MRGLCTTQSTTSEKRSQTWSEQEELEALRVAHDATKAKLESE
jgi:hypothetical protein